MDGQATQADESNAGSQFMRPFVIGVTGYLIMTHVLYFVTSGKMGAHDRWLDIYLLILGVYSGGGELHHWAKGSEPEKGWSEQIRRGGPIITVWVIFLFALGAWRLVEPERPMPPELKETTMGVIGVFFGTYTLRQLRRSSTGNRMRVQLAGKLSSSATPSTTTNSAEDETAILEFLRKNGASSAGAISDSLALPRRTLTRLLAHMVANGAIVRSGASPTDPSSTYRTPGDAN